MKNNYQSQLLIPDLCATLIIQFLLTNYDKLQLSKFSRIDFSLAYNLMPIFSKAWTSSLTFRWFSSQDSQQSIAFSQSFMSIPLRPSKKFIFLKTLSFDNSKQGYEIPDLEIYLNASFNCFSSVQHFYYFSILYFNLLILSLYSFTCSDIFIIIENLLIMSEEKSRPVQQKCEVSQSSKTKQLNIISEQIFPPEQNSSIATEKAKNKKGFSDDKYQWKQDQSYGFQYAVYEKNNDQKGHTHSKALTKSISEQWCMADIERWVKVANSVKKEVWLTSENEVVLKLELRKKL